MRILLDTQILLWAKAFPARLPKDIEELIRDPELDLEFSAASVWEIAIKQSQRRADFTVDAALMRLELLATGYSELPVLGHHAVAVATLPPIHRDPFDRILVAQAMVEDIQLVTVDTEIAKYPGPIRVF